MQKPSTMDADRLNELAKMQGKQVMSEFVTSYPPALMANDGYISGTNKTASEKLRGSSFAK